MSGHDQLQRSSQHLRFELAQDITPEAATEREVEFSYSATEYCSYRVLTRDGENISHLEQPYG
jgi:hypothetical protein